MNRSEVVRVGLSVLADMTDVDLRDIAAKLERLAVWLAARPPSRALCSRQITGRRSSGKLK